MFVLKFLVTGLLNREYELKGSAFHLWDIYLGKVVGLQASAAGALSMDKKHRKEQRDNENTILQHRCCSKDHTFDREWKRRSLEIADAQRVLRKTTDTSSLSPAVIRYGMKYIRNYDNVIPVFLPFSPTFSCFLYWILCI